MLENFVLSSKKNPDPDVCEDCGKPIFDDEDYCIDTCRGCQLLLCEECISNHEEVPEDCF